MSDANSVPARLLPLLGCPACDAALSPVGAELACTRCGRRIQVRAGVPYFVPISDVPASASAPADTADAARGLPAPLRPRHHAVNLEDLTSSTRASPRLQRFLASFGAEQNLANVGSLGTDFEGQVRVWNLDLAPVPHVSVVGDAHRLPFREGTLDGVLLKNVLEHVADPTQVVAECRRALRPGGRLFAKIPFLQPFHAEPTDFFRFSQGGVRKLFEDWEILDEGVAIGPGSAINWIVLEWYQVWSPFRLRHRWLHFAGYWALSWLMAPVKLLDRWVRDAPEAHRVASCLYVEARKPGA